MRPPRKLSPWILTALLAVPASSAPSVLVGPDILVSRDSDLPHLQTAIAANPLNPKNLAGSCIDLGHWTVNGGNSCAVYATWDGGTTWSTNPPESLLPERRHPLPVERRVLRPVR